MKKMTTRLLAFCLLLMLCLPSCTVKDPAPDGSQTADLSSSETVTEAETDDVFADVDVDGHTLKKMADGLYCIQPKHIASFPNENAAVISNIFFKSIDEYREKLLNGGFSEEEYQIIHTWPKTSYGVMIPDPNRMRDLILPEDWCQSSLMVTGSTYSFFIGNQADTMGACVNMIRPDQFGTEYDSARLLACQALTQPDGVQREGNFNDIPCTIYEYYPKGKDVLNRGYWLDLSTDSEELYVAVLHQPENVKSVLIVNLVGKTADGTAYTISFYSESDAESLKVYTADFFRSFRPAPLK